MLAYLETAKDYSLIGQLNLGDQYGKKLEAFLLRQGRYKDSILQVLTDIEPIDRMYLIDSIGKGETSELKKMNRVSFDKIFNFKPTPTSQMGPGELLSAIIFDGHIATDNKFDLELHNGQKCEVKTTRDGLYRFGSAKDKTIHAVNIDGIRFWNEILYTVNKILSIGENNIINLFEEDDGLDELRNSIKIITGDVLGINSGAFPKTLFDHFEYFYESCHTLRKGGEDDDEAEYSRIELKGNFTQPSKINIEPITKQEVAHAVKTDGMIQIKPAKANESRDLTIGKLNDLHYVRHPQNFKKHWDLIPANILSKDTVYIFFNKYNNIAASGTGEQIYKRLSLESVTDGRLKFRLRA